MIECPASMASRSRASTSIAFVAARRRRRSIRNPLEIQGAERRQIELQAGTPAHPWLCGRDRLLLFVVARAAPRQCIAVEELAIAPGVRHTDEVRVAGDRSEIEHTHDRRLGLSGKWPPQKGID